VAAAVSGDAGFQVRGMGLDAVNGDLVGPGEDPGLAYEGQVAGHVELPWRA
jgi:hypothetical protein